MQVTNSPTFKNLILKLRTQNLLVWCGAQGTDFFEAIYIMNLLVFIQNFFFNSRHKVILSGEYYYSSYPPALTEEENRAP